MSRPQQQSRLLGLPQEVQNIIYSCLLPDAITTYLDEVPTYTIPARRLRATSPDYEALRNVKACMMMARVCSSIRNEVIPLVIPRLKFAFGTRKAADRFTSVLTVRTKLLVRDLHFLESGDKSRNSNVRPEWLRSLSGYFSIRRLQIDSIYMPEDLAHKGTNFDENDLRLFKAIATQLPTLSEAYMAPQPHSRHQDYRIIYLQSSDIPQEPDSTKFSPEDEYKKYLAKQRQKAAIRRNEDKAEKAREEKAKAAQAKRE